jgi:tryptophan-rich sensory protein
MSRQNACPPSRYQPPGIVFAVVWPILYLLVGVSSALLFNQGHFREVAFIAALVVALNAWWVAFGPVCRPVGALASILTLLVFTAALAAHVASKSYAAAALLAPLIAWLSFASFLSVSLLIPTL